MEPEPDDGDAQYFAVVGRLKPPVPNNVTILEIKIDIIDKFHTHFTADDMKFVQPYFVIRLRTPEAQSYLLSLRTLHGSRFTMYVAPWCLQYELAQLPWIMPYNPLEDPNMESTIYVPSVEATYPMEYFGNQQHYLNSYIGDVRPQTAPNAPDFSCLMIADLQNFYKKKTNAFSVCACSCRSVCDVIHQVYRSLLDIAYIIYNHTEAVDAAPIDGLNFRMGNFVDRLQYQVKCVEQDLQKIYKTSEKNYYKVCPTMKLLGFDKIASAYQVSTSAEYTSKLEMILQAVVGKIYNVHATIDTQQIQNQGYRTCVTSGKFQPIFWAPHTMNIHQARAQAIYKFLRFTTNNMGYSIIDVDYSTLTHLVTELNACNAEMNKLFICARDAKYSVKWLLEGCTQNHDDLVQVYNPQELPLLHRCSSSFISTMHQQLEKMNIAYAKFIMDKDAYDSIIMDEG